jgi:hypothetical protein
VSRLTVEAFAATPAVDSDVWQRRAELAERRVRMTAGSSKNLRIVDMYR